MTNEEKSRELAGFQESIKVDWLHREHYADGLEISGIDVELELGIRTKEGGDKC